MEQQSIMTKKKGNIIFSVIISIALLVLAYLFGIIIEFTYNWITSEFLFVVFSGAFASSLVVLISEIFTYKQLKKTLENELNFYTIKLFETVCITKNMLKSIIDNSDYQIPDFMLKHPRDQMLAELGHICNIDYNPFNKKQELCTKLQVFKNNYTYYSRIINDCISFDLAVSVSRLQTMQNYNCNKPINSTYPLVSKSIQILQKNFDTLLNGCDELLNIIDCYGRFKWQETKEKIFQNTRINLASGSLEEFFKRNE